VATRGALEGFMSCCWILLPLVGFDLLITLVFDVTLGSGEEAKILMPDAAFDKGDTKPILVPDTPSCSLL